MTAKIPPLASSLLLFSLLISGCTRGAALNTKAPEVAATNLPVATVTKATQATTESDQIPESVTATPEPTTDAPSPVSYNIDARLDYEAKQVEVDQEIRVSGWLTGVREMALVVEPNRYANGFVLHSLEVDQILITDYSLESNQLRFALPENAQSSGNAVFHLSYTVYLPQIPPPSEMFKPQPYGYTDRQVNLVDWYPFVPPLDENKEWIIHRPPYFGESLVYPAADYEINLTIRNNNLPLIVAASSPAEQNENTYSYSMPAARTFAISISPYYQVVETEIDGINIKSFAFAGYEDQNQAVLQNAGEALDLFTELFGPLPIKSVSIVQADFLDGMEYNGLYFVSKGFYDLYDGTVQGYLTLISVHEMAHQWWFGVVGNDQAMEPWLDEGLATFAELQYMERYHPDLVNWWWAYRVNFYEPEGPINLSIYDYSSYTAYRNAVYLRGAKFMYDLRSEIGEEAFDKGMKRYCQDNTYKIASKDDFFQAISQAGDHPSESLISQYFAVKK